MSDFTPNEEESKRFMDRLDSIESRLAELESAIGTLTSSQVPSNASQDRFQERPEISLKIKPGDDSLLESNIGEYGLAWVGNIVLFFGIIFLMQYITTLQKPLFAALIGFVSVSGILLLSRVLKRSYSYISFLFGVFGQLLLFYVTLRLHFYTADAIIQSRWIGITLLFVVVGIQVIIALRSSSEFYAGLALLLLVAVAVIGDATHLMLATVTVASAGTVFLFYRYAWYRVLIISIILTYLIFFNWILNNPFVGNPVQGISSPQYSYIYLAACAAIFSMVTLVPEKGRFPKGIILSSVLLNGLSFTALLSLWVVAFFPEDYIWLFLSIALFCIPFSILLKLYSDWKYSPALYALYGFVAISVAIYGLYKFPDAFLLLSAQSFLVAVIALWYRSRIIIVMNVCMFVIIIITYLSMDTTNNLINFSFPVVAFLSVRLINWQKERLKLQTELIRNTYLVVLIITTLHALYHAFSGHWVTLSWTLASLLFFGLSLVLRNMKYRWMALASLIATAVYLFAVDLANVEIIYRIVAFLSLALISIGISFYYVKKIKQRQNAKR